MDSVFLLDQLRFEPASKVKNVGRTQSGRRLVAGRFDGCQEVVGRGRPLDRGGTRRVVCTRCGHASTGFEGLLNGFLTVLTARSVDGNRLSHRRSHMGTEVVCTLLLCIKG